MATRKPLVLVNGNITQLQAGDVVSGAGLSPTDIKTGNYTAVAGELVRTNSTGSAFTITLPAAPIDGDRVGVVDITGNNSVNAITIDRNGKTINEASSNLTSNVNFEQIEFLYNGSTSDWTIVSRTQYFSGTNPTQLSTASAGTSNTIARSDHVHPNVVNWLDFTPQGTPPAHVHGRVYFDTTEDALTVQPASSNVSMQLGQEVWVRSKNATGVTIADGSVVYMSGAVGASGVPEISLALANDLDTSRMIGVTTETITNGSIGAVTVIGKVRGINTNAWSEGTQLYLSETTPGALTSTRPMAPNYDVPVGVVVNQHASNGTIIVLPATPVLGPGTSGSVAFFGPTGELTQDNANLHWDDTNNRLGVLTSSPDATFDVSEDPLWTIGTSPTPTVVASDTGGTVAAGTYYFKVVATFRGGFAAAGAESSGATVTTSTGSISISWTPEAGAAFYQVFRTTAPGTYTSPSLIAVTSGSSFTWADGAATSGTPVTSNGQNIYGGKAWINDLFTSTGTQYSSMTVNSVSALTANDTNLTHGLTVRKTVPAASTYNHGNQRGVVLSTDFRGSGTSGVVQGLFSQTIYSGTGASVGTISGTVVSATYTGTNTITAANIYGASANAGIASSGRATNMYGGSFVASVSSNGSSNPTAGTVYGVRGDATHSSTGKTVDAMYGSYGIANATSSGGTATRIQGGYFQASVGNGSGGGVVTAPTHRGIEGWAYQNVTGTCSYVYGGQFSTTIQGTVSNETMGANIYVNNESTVATTPLVIGARITSINYQTANDTYGSILENLHLGASTMPSATGTATAVRVNNAGGTITTAKGLVVNVLQDAGTIGTAYGIYLDNVQGTSAWGFYQNGAVKNYFAGQVLINTTTDDGVNKLQVNGGITANGLQVTTKYISTFNNTTDWGTASGGYYSITVLVGSHKAGTSPTVQIFELTGSDYDMVQVDRIRVNSSGDITIRVPETPDGRFTGKIVVI